MVNKTYFRYWGKAKKNQVDSTEPNYHLLVFHSLDVAAVGWHLLDPGTPLSKRLSAQLDIDAKWLQQWFSFCLAIHDIGKFSLTFQSLVPNLSENLIRCDAVAKSERHDSIGFVIWQDRFSRWQPTENIRTNNRHIEPWIKIVTGHHGMPPKRLNTAKAYCEPQQLDDVVEFVADLQLLLLDGFDYQPLVDKNLGKKIKQCSWTLAGVAVLADWLGSNRDYFNYVAKPIPLDEYWQHTLENNAPKAITHTQIQPKAVKPLTEIKALFSFIKQATPLQKKAFELDINNEPQLFILEDVTGAGKTEAAMILAHRLMSRGLADGIFVGLPTQATANGMYRRLSKVYRKLYRDDYSPSIVLAHGARLYSKLFTDTIALSDPHPVDSNYDDELSASAFCSAWVADSNKKSLLADIGVGTIDQALLAILPSRHQSLKLFGLSRKILIIDEVHAYDSYMQALLETLLTTHAMQGGSVIMLSATMPKQMREKLLNAYRKGCALENKKLDDQPYPLLTHSSSQGVQQIPLDTREEVKRTVKVELVHQEQQVIDKILALVAKGHCVCWVRNTVRSAKKAFQLLSEQLSPHQLSLFHSKFTMVDRQRIENQVIDVFGDTHDDKTVDASQIRQGQVLVATQVVEQSLDLDFDYMFSDLAPIDLLIQRAGRLQRHVRDAKGNRLAKGQKDQRPDPILYLLTPSTKQPPDENWLQRLLAASEAIYRHLGRLWLTAQTLENKREFSMPADARDLINNVYGADVEIPEALEDKAFVARYEEKLQSNLGKANALKIEKGYCQDSAEDNSGWDDETKKSTRLIEEGVKVALATIKDGRLQPYATTDQHPWQMSTLTITVKDWEIVKKQIDSCWLEQIQQLKTEHNELRWLEILPLDEAIKQHYSESGGWLLE